MFVKAQNNDHTDATNKQHFVAEQQFTDPLFGLSNAMKALVQQLPSSERSLSALYHNGEGLAQYHPFSIRIKCSEFGL